MDVKVSIVVPVYNTESHLRRCLDSLSNQSLREIEIICVNDASPGNALEIIGEYQNKDARIKLVNFSENRGVSIARNAGMEIASGEYVGFVDSDDTVDEDFYFKLYEEAIASQSDIAKGLMRALQEDGGSRIISNESIKNNKYNFLAYYTTAIYKLAFLRAAEVTFPSGITRGQDLVFSNKAVLCAESISFVEDVCYNYISSGRGSAMTIPVLQTYLDALAMIVEELNKHDLSTENYLIIFSKQFSLALVTPGKVHNEYRQEAYAVAAKALCQMYANCLYKEAFLAQNSSVVHDFVARGETEKLVEYWGTYTNFSQRFLADVRYKMRREGKI